MFLFTPTEDDNVVYVNQAYRAQKTSQDLFHGPLEQLRGVTKTHGHPVPLEKTLMTYEGCFLSVVWMDWQLVKAGLEIQC